MYIADLEGNVVVTTAEELTIRLELVRHGVYGAYMLSHGDGYPVLSVHLNGSRAYVHYSPDDGHPGYQACGMEPDGCPENVHFLNIDGQEGGAFDMPDCTLVSAEMAYAAAVEFLRSPRRPDSIDWFEL